MLHTVGEKQQQEARGAASNPNRTWVRAAHRTARTCEDRRGAGSAAGTGSTTRGARDYRGWHRSLVRPSQDLPQREVMDNLVDRPAAPEDSR